MGSPIEPRYTGQILIPGTELYYYKARVYHPELGRFMQTDPIGYQDGMNWYAYVGNDPLNKNDPDGKFAWVLLGAAIGGAANAISQGMTKGWDKIDYTQVGVAAVAGGLAVVGAGMVSVAATELGLTGMTAAAANVVGNTVNGAVIGAASATANYGIDSAQGDPTTGTIEENAASGAATGALYGAAGSMFSEGATKLIKSMSGSLVGDKGTITNGVSRVIEGVSDVIGAGPDIQIAIDPDKGD